MGPKVVSAQDAALLIRSGETLATSGFVGIGVPEQLLVGLEQRFLDSGEPRDLSLLFAAGQGDGKSRGLNRLAHDGLVRRAIGGHWGLIPKLGQLALANRIEAYNLPQGVISQLYREIAAGRPGLITKVGLGSFVDPAEGGGKINDITTQDLVREMEIDGTRFLFYAALPIDVVFLRATTADETGNLSMEREALVLDNLAMATAARNSGGLVIAQVERLAARGSLPAKAVTVPGALVDAVVVAEAEHHCQTFATGYSPAFSGEVRVPPAQRTRLPLDARKVIARRCAMELPPNGIVNLGIGMPEGVAAVAREEGVLDAITLTAEPGILGGEPAAGLDFGAAVNTEAVIPQSAQFDLYDGGGLDLACLGMAEANAAGDVNVSRFGSRLAGAGGFINISQNARKVIFAGTFTAGGLSMEVAEGRLIVAEEGRAAKFVSEIEQVTFKAAQAWQSGRAALYVTERAVFRLTERGLELSEIAPGIDLERDVLARMGFEPRLGSIKTMDQRLFQKEDMGLEEILYDLRMEDRIALDPATRRLFLNFDGMRVRARSDIQRIKEEVERQLAPLDQRVDVIVSYNRFDLASGLERAYAEMVQTLEEKHYRHISRYSTSAFLRLKLNRTLTRQQTPHLFETREAAQSFLAERT